MRETLTWMCVEDISIVTVREVCSLICLKYQATSSPTFVAKEGVDA